MDTLRGGMMIDFTYFFEKPLSDTIILIL